MKRDSRNDLVSQNRWELIVRSTNCFGIWIVLGLWIIQEYKIHLCRIMCIHKFLSPTGFSNYSGYLDWQSDQDHKNKTLKYLKILSKSERLFQVFYIKGFFSVSISWRINVPMMVTSVIKFITLLNIKLIMDHFMHYFHFLLLANSFSRNTAALSLSESNLSLSAIT